MKDLLLLQLKETQVKSFSGSRTKISKWADKRLIVFAAVSLLLLLAKVGGEWTAETIQEWVRNKDERAK